MNVEQQDKYMVFMAQEKSKYRDGYVTVEERKSYESELLLLRAFRVSDDTLPMLASRGVLA
ncbi:hypothetical protein BK133_18110 [Paenibacillus sp. FSL H8-0548]|uniref:hypothetical protein n=1 Tax=Paenibacillus sp. FSL H8-0548 TaxID=1920422 RepID=UPI00096BF6B5|nr:hypothetical protein [Paenibacillus sp. FSL H8-0548]OMF29061.1 hypothetical protein BK133_18110 [Paenibacillus sp. FSL H8-0548]